MFNKLLLLFLKKTLNDVEPVEGFVYDALSEEFEKAGLNIEKFELVNFNKPGLNGFIFLNRIIGINNELCLDETIRVLRHEIAHYKLKHYGFLYFILKLAYMLLEQTLQRREREADEYYALYDN